MTKKKVIIDVPPIHDDGLKAFEHASDVEVIRYNRDKPILDVVSDAVGIMAGLSIFDEAVFETAPNLKIIAKHGVGYCDVCPFAPEVEAPSPPVSGRPALDHPHCAHVGLSGKIRDMLSSTYSRPDTNR